MSIEAMKQMANYIDVLGGDSKKYRQVIEQAEKQEPVAWVCYGMSSDEKHSIDYEQDDIDALPVGTMLYATPQPQEFVCSTGLCRFTLTQTGVGIGERGMQAYEEAKKRGWVGISDELESPQQSEQGVSNETRTI